jgi:hypothetical protein
MLEGSRQSRCVGFNVVVIMPTESLIGGIKKLWQLRCLKNKPSHRPATYRDGRIRRTFPGYQDSRLGEGNYHPMQLSTEAHTTLCTHPVDDLFYKEEVQIEPF